MAEEFRRRELSFREQVAVPVDARGKIIGRHFLDFLVAAQIVIELKQGRRIYRRHLQQVFGYLTAMKLPLAIVANFGPEELSFRRVVNFEMVSSNS